MILWSEQKSSQKADEYLREIKEQNVLGDAVRQCVEAAAHEYDPDTQKALMRVRTPELQLEPGRPGWWV